jgi:hypothetical protein
MEGSAMTRLSMTRRRFLRTCGAGLAVAAPLAALGGCTSQDAENFAKAFGEAYDRVDEETFG